MHWWHRGCIWSSRVGCIVFRLARRPMGLVAPVAAVVAAIIPVLFGFWNEGLPAWGNMVGFTAAIFAVCLISQGDAETSFHLSDLKLPLSAGLGFGFFIVMIDRVSSNAILWPLVSTRSASILLILGIVLHTRRIEVPVIRQIPIIALARIFDTSGNFFFAVATRIGR
jgi:hypothetical protein